MLILAFFASFRLILDFTLSEQKSFSVFLKIVDIFVFCGFLVDFETYEFESNMAGPSNSSMAGSKRKMEYELKREIYEKIAPNLACSFCEIVPRRGPLFASKSGNISACPDCKNEKLPNGIPIAFSEGILAALPLVACRFKKNDCKIVQDPKNISYHEEECEHRDVECIVRSCSENVDFSKLTDHLFEDHRKSFFTPFGTKFVDDAGETEWSFRVEKEQFLPKPNGKPWRALIGPFSINEKYFFLQSEINPLKENFLAWLQMFGSKFEAKNYRYSIQLQEKEDLGTQIYLGPVKSLDDRKTDVFKSKVGLVVPLDVLKRHVGEEMIMVFQIKIEDLKPKDDEMDSEASNQDD